MRTSRPFTAAALVIVLVAGASAAGPEQPTPASKDAAKAAFWSTPAPKSGGGWGTPEKAPAAEAVPQKVTKAPQATPTPTSASSSKAAIAPATTKPTPASPPALRAMPSVASAPAVAPARKAPAARRPRAPGFTLAWSDEPLAAMATAPAAAVVQAGEVTPAPAAPSPALVAVEEGVVTTAPAPTPAPAPAPAVAAPAVAATPQIATPKDPARPIPSTAPKATPGTPNPFPSWFNLNVFYRGRVESTRSIAVRASEYDRYYLNRLRMRATFTVSPNLEIVGEGQDSRVGYYDGVGVPKNMRNVFDLRQAYLDVHATNGKDWRLRAGRQEIAFGDGRLVASSDWGNVNRTYDIVRGSVARGRAKVDVFGGFVVQTEPDIFDERKPGEHFYGAWGVIDKVAPSTAVEPFVVVKYNETVVGEDAVIGDSTLVSVGTRVTSKLWNRVDTATDVIVQQGTFANDDILGWAFHQSLGMSFAKTMWKPRVVVDYATASGDTDPKDGRRQTFDSLYPSNHNRYGLADQVGWRNVHFASLQADATPRKWLKVGAATSQFFLGSVNDGLYASSGTRVVLNRKATSRNVGLEVDGWFQWTISKELSLAGGLSALLPGRYLEESTDGRILWAPYVFWNVKF